MNCTVRRDTASINLTGQEIGIYSAPHKTKQVRFLPDLFMSQSSLFDLNDEWSSGAEFSPCRVWRYALWRRWDFGSRCNMVAFVGLNPSTADESLDDATIRRCINFAKSWGYDGMYMLNAYAFRATDPRDMKAFHEPIGKDNDCTIARISSEVD